MRLLFTVLLASIASALDIGPPRLPGNNTYISYGLGPSVNNSLIICTYSLDEGEEVSTIQWDVLKRGQAAGSFEWNANGTGKATGLLEDKVNLDRDDSDLELTALSYDLSANYTCTVTATDGTKGSATDEILVIDTTTNHIYEIYHPNEAECIIKESVAFFPVFPKPTVFGGFYVEETGRYFDIITAWEVDEYLNGSAAYSLKDYEFKVDKETPYNAVIRINYGVTKANGTYIKLITLISQLDFKHSCRDLKISENQTVSYNTNSHTCFGEPYLPQGKVAARVECAKGYLSAGELSSVTMYCESTNTTDYHWVPGSEGLTPENLYCESWASTARPSYLLILLATLMLYFNKY